MDYYPSGLAERLEVSSPCRRSLSSALASTSPKPSATPHREGVIHRDIKVDNILFDAHGNAVVADFGIARALSGYIGQTGTNMVVGTPQYFAPEQARAKPLDGQSGYLLTRGYALPRRDWPAPVRGRRLVRDRPSTRRGAAAATAEHQPGPVSGLRGGHSALPAEVAGRYGPRRASCWRRSSWRCCRRRSKHWRTGRASLAPSLPWWCDPTDTLPRPSMAPPPSARACRGLRVRSWLRA